MKVYIQGDENWELCDDFYFAAYLAAQLALWFAPVIFVNKKNRPECD